MAKARVTLTKALTHGGRGRQFTKGQPQIIDNDADIAYYKAQPEFSVTPLVDPKRPKPKPEPDEGAAQSLKHEAVRRDEGDEAEPITAESLAKLTKLDLINLAANEPYNLALDNEMKKADMITAIMDIMETSATLTD